MIRTISSIVPIRIKLLISSLICVRGEKYQNRLFLEETATILFMTLENKKKGLH